MKGAIYSLEAVISIVMIASVIFLFVYRKPSPPEFTKLNFKLAAYDGLKILDEAGELRRYALENDVSSIENALDAYIPVSYSVTLFNKTTNTTPIPTIQSDDVVTVSYFLAGSVANYKPIEVRVYIWWLK